MSCHFSGFVATLGRAVRNRAKSILRSLRIQRRNHQINRSEADGGRSETLARLSSTRNNGSGEKAQRRIRPCRFCGCGDQNYGITEEGKAVKREGGRWIEVG